MTMTFQKFFTKPLLKSPWLNQQLQFFCAFKNVVFQTWSSWISWSTWADPLHKRKVDEPWLLHISKRSKESFTNYVDKFLNFFDHLPIPGWHLWRNSFTVWKKNLYNHWLFQYHLPSTSSCQRILWMIQKGPSIYYVNKDGVGWGQKSGNFCWCSVLFMLT